MPVLPIVDSEGKLLPAAQPILLAHTTYPDDGDKLEELLACLLVNQILIEVRNPESMLLELATNNPWLIPALHTAPTPEKVLKDANQADRSAWAAGEILLTMLCVSTFHPEIDVNVKMAIEVISEFQTEGGTVPASESTLWNSWSRFKTVSHFHAVRQAWVATAESPPVPEKFIAWRIGSFEEYLGCAEYYRTLAVSKRFLTFEECWRVPENLQLPAIKIELGPLEPELLAVFRRYRA